MEQQEQILELYNQLTRDTQDNSDLIQQHMDQKEDLRDRLENEREQAERDLLAKKDAECSKKQKEVMIKLDQRFKAESTKIKQQAAKDCQEKVVKIKDVLTEKISETCKS